MRWRGGRRSDNVEDQRGAGGIGGGFGFPRRGTGLPGGGMRIPVGGGGIGGMGLLILLILFLVFGGGLGDLLGPGPSEDQSTPETRQMPQLPETGAGSSSRTTGQQTASGSGDPRTEEELADFVKVVLGSTEDTWNALFQQSGRDYPEPNLVLFSGQVESACGFAQAAMGPFYCPLDRKVYIDLSFYRDMSNKLGAPGDFAEAYVIAHEIGHHVQTILGISDQVRAEQSRGSTSEANAIQVRMELQADCLAGVWANHAENTSTIALEPGDIEEALNAANAIGDDRLQKRSQGYVVPDAFTHGSSAQRVRWFERGYSSGSMRDCDTFAAEQL